MHLVHPSLNHLGKSKTKKFRNSTQAKNNRELKDSWGQLLNTHGINPNEKKHKEPMKTLSYKLAPPPGRSTTNHIKSLETNHTGPLAAKPTKTYTGDQMLGVCTMHKSNAVPVFSSEHATEISRMRRG
jgi:hypothetical protein